MCYLEEQLLENPHRLQDGQSSVSGVFSWLIVFFCLLFWIVFSIWNDFPQSNFGWFACHREIYVFVRINRKFNLIVYMSSFVYDFRDLPFLYVNNYFRVYFIERWGWLMIWYKFRREISDQQITNMNWISFFWLYCIGLLILYYHFLLLFIKFQHFLTFYCISFSILLMLFS